MRTSTVQASWNMFLNRLSEELDISAANGRLLSRFNRDEFWIAPHAVERPDEDCINDDLYKY